MLVLESLATYMYLESLATYIYLESLATYIYLESLATYIYLESLATYIYLESLATYIYLESLATYIYTLNPLLRMYTLNPLQDIYTLNSLLWNKLDDQILSGIKFENPDICFYLSLFSQSHNLHTIGPFIELSTTGLQIFQCISKTNLVLNCRIKCLFGKDQPVSGIVMMQSG